MNNAELFRVGLITRPLGLKGELSVVPLTDDPERFRRLDEVYLEGADDGAAITLRVEGVRYHRGRVIVKFEGCDDAAGAGAYRGSYISVTREMLLPLREGNWYVFDLVGCSVYDADGARLGELVEVLETGGNDVYVVRPELPGDDILIPALKSVVREVDVANKRIVAAWNNKDAY